MSHCDSRAWRASRQARERAAYGVVAASVNVSVLWYPPTSSASVAATGCLNWTATGALANGPVHVFRTTGLEAPPIGANAPPAAAWSACGRARSPLTRCPGAVDDRSATVSLAPCALEVAVTVVEAR